MDLQWGIINQILTSNLWIFNSSGCTKAIYYRHQQKLEVLQLSSPLNKLVKKSYKLVRKNCYQQDQRCVVQ